MDTIIIHVSWEWALGIFAALSGCLIGIAWKGSARFTVLETSVKWLRADMEWVKSILKDMKTNSDSNTSVTPVFMSKSPINLTQAGEQWLNESGLKEYIDSHPKEFIEAYGEKKSANPYEVQQFAFRLLGEIILDPIFEDQIKKFAFEKGTSMDVLRRIGAIYLRNLCLNNFGMKSEDIDTHDPEKIT